MIYEFRSKWLPLHNMKFSHGWKVWYSGPLQSLSPKFTHYVLIEPSTYIGFSKGHDKANFTQIKVYGKYKYTWNISTWDWFAGSKNSVITIFWIFSTNNVWDFENCQVSPLCGSTSTIVRFPNPWQLGNLTTSTISTTTDRYQYH